MATELPQLPDLYQLLQLEPLEDDRSKIESALRRLLAHGRELQAQQPKQAQRLAKIVELGKRHLLTADAKAKYDAYWHNVHQPQLATVGTASSWDMSELESHLPAGDPFQAFDLAAFLSSADPLPTTEPAADFAKLQALLLPASPPALANQTTTQPHAALSPPPLDFELRGTSSAPQIAAANPALQPPARRKTSLAKALRAKRDRSLLKIAAGILLTLSAVLSVLFWMMKPGTQTQPEKPLAANNGAQAIASRATPSGDSPSVERPRGSGLPKVKGLDSASSFDGNFENNNSPESDTIAPESTPFDMKLTMNSPADLDPDESMVDEMAMEEAPALSDDEKQAWRELLLSIRKQIGEQAYSAAREKLEQAAAQAKSIEQQSQLKRLQALAKLSEEFHSALVSAITGLGAGESFMVKSTPVSIVEGSAEKIVIRNRGRNESYTLIEIPVGLAYALSDLKLDSVHPSSLARKAAFALVHPRSNELVLAKAREMMAEAIASKVVDADLMDAFDDDFALP